MIKIETSDSHPLTLIPEVTRPVVYLDYCVIANLANAKISLGQEFRESLLDKGGTLYLSWAHLIELMGLAVGPTYYAIRSFLASFGPNFILIDPNASAVIHRETAWSPGKQNPAFHEDFLVAWISNWSGMSELDMTPLLDVMATDSSLISEWKIKLKEHKDKIKQVFDFGRTQYREDPQVKKRLDNASYLHRPGTPPTKYIYEKLMRECIITNDEFNLSDGIDFEHCVVSLAYCDYVVFDKKWARRCKEIILPSEAAEVFSSPEIGTFVDKIKSANKPCEKRGLRQQAWERRMSQ